MSKAISPPGLRLRPFPFFDFQGLDVSRDRTGLDTGKRQALIGCENAHCDWRGQIVKDPGVNRRASPNAVIEHVDFYGRGLVAWAQRDGSGQITLNSDRSHSLPDVFPAGSVVSSTTFNKKLHFAAKGQAIRTYDGAVWTRNSSALQAGPANVAASQRRLICSGIPNKPTEIHFSRADNETAMPEDEPDGSTDVLRGSYLDISNLIGTADEIVGHGPFETNRLAIFTRDQTLVYIINPDLTKWSIDERANVKVGCISHRTIRQANADLLFCARSGVYSLRRSVDNAIQLYSIPLSEKIDLLYRELIARTDDTARISAVWDQDAGQYHIFFPHGAATNVATRLTWTQHPTDPERSKWSTGTFLNARCGAFLGGEMVFGTPGGLFDQRKIEDDTATLHPESTVLTPVLWHGSINEIKESYNLVIHATGQGTIEVEAFNEEGRELDSLTVTIDEPQDDVFPDLPLSRQYTRKFEHRYRGVQLRFTLKGKGLCRIIGFAINVR